jgi:hypothetical protein
MQGVASFAFRYERPIDRQSRLSDCPLMPELAVIVDVEFAVQ